MSLTNINNDNIFKKGVIGNVRKAQEDSHDMKVMTPNGDLFVVCDGMGGHVGGAKASSIAVSSIIEYLNKEKYNNIPQALSDAIQFANMQIIGFASANPEFKGMGTTACILLLTEKEAYIAHVGDSRIYMYLGNEKELHRVTKDHSYVQTLVDAGQISDDEAEHHPNKNRILKALGIRSEMDPTIAVVHPKNDDVFMICTDGLNGMICDKTIEQVLRQEISIEQKGELLINLAMQGENGCPGGQDNCTVELIKIDNSPWSKSEFTSYNPKKQKASKINPSTGLGTSGNTSQSPQPPQSPQSKKPLKKILWIVIAFMIGIYLLSVIGSGPSDEKRIEELKPVIDTCKVTARNAIDEIIKCGYTSNIIQTQRDVVVNFMAKFKDFNSSPSIESVIVSIKKLENEIEEMSETSENADKGISSEKDDLINSLKLLLDYCSLLREIEDYKSYTGKDADDLLFKYRVRKNCNDGNMEGADFIKLKN